MWSVLSIYLCLKLKFDKLVSIFKKNLNDLKIYCLNYVQTQNGDCNTLVGNVKSQKEASGVRLPIFSCRCKPSNNCVNNDRLAVGFVEAPRNFTGTTTPNGERRSYNQWVKVVKNLFQPIELRQNEIAAMMQVQPRCQFNEEVERLIRESHG